MRQRCELCEALGADSSRGRQLIGMALGPRDALLCTDHALFALDADVESVRELCELYQFVAEVEPAPGEAAVAVAAREGSHGAATSRATASMPRG